MGERSSSGRMISMALIEAIKGLSFLDLPAVGGAGESKSSHDSHVMTSELRLMELSDI